MKFWAFELLLPHCVFWGGPLMWYFPWPTNKWGIATPPSIQGRCSSKTLWFWRGIERKERDRKIYSVYTLKNCGFLALLCMQNKLWQLVVCTLSMIPFWGHIGKFGSKQSEITSWNSAKAEFSQLKKGCWKVFLNFFYLPLQQTKYADSVRLRKFYHTATCKYASKNLLNSFHKQGK